MTPRAESWLEVRIEASGAALEAASNFAFEQGALGIEEVPGGLRAFFPSGASGAVAALCAYTEELAGLGERVGRPEASVLRDGDWGRAWRENFRPLRAGRRFVVHPPWEPAAAGPGDLSLCISPKMAFGTGSHETTRLCLAMIEDHASPGDAVLDVGTGSGILAIAALKLGAARAVAVDVEEESVENAVENRGLNGLGPDRLDVRLGSLDAAPEGPADLVVANIDRRTLLPMIPAFVSRTRPGTRVVLSGLLAAESGEITAALERSGFRVSETRTDGEWAGIFAERVR